MTFPTLEHKRLVLFKLLRGGLRYFAEILELKNAANSAPIATSTGKGNTASAPNGELEPFE